MYLKSYLLWGLIFSLLSVISDHLLLWHSGFNPLQNDFQFLKHLSSLRILVGVWMGIMAIFGEVFCLLKVIDLLYKDSCLKKLNFLILILLLGFGITYHFGLGLIWEFIRSNLDTAVILTYFIRPLEIIIGIVFILLNISWYYLNKNEGSRASRTLSQLLPIWIYVVGLGFSLLHFEVGKMILLSGFNLCIAVIFLIVIRDQFNQSPPN